MKRIAIGCVSQEVNAFNHVLTTMDDFKTSGLSYGEEIIDLHSDDRFEVSGFIQASKSEGDVKLIPTLYAATTPGGVCENKTYRFLKRKLLSLLKDAGKLDGILLCFHGAMSAVEEPDVEGAILERIRKTFGAKIPIVISLDHHANVTRKMIESVNGVAGYKTQPHKDHFETGAKAAGIMFSTLNQRCRPIVSWRKIPMLAAGNLRTDGGPLGDFFKQAAAYEKKHQRVLDVSIFPGFAWSEVSELGWSVVVTTDGDEELGQSIADELAKAIWRKRTAFQKEKKCSVPKAIDMAIKTKGGPVILSDAADSINSGAPGDGTAILKEMIGKELGGSALVTIVDPEAVATCVKAGVGAKITLNVGGKYDQINTPAKVTGIVKTISDGRCLKYVNGKKTTPFNMKRVAVLETGDIFIVLSEFRGPGHLAEVYEMVGLDPRQAKIVVVKSPYLFRDTFGPFAKKIILVDAPGLRTANLPSIASLYKSPPSPIYPLDKSVRFI